MQAVDAVLGAFEDSGLVRRTANEPATFPPARARRRRRAGPGPAG